MTPPAHLDPLAQLARWEESGAIWRLRSFDGQEAVVDLLSCGGEPVGELRSDDPGLRELLARRPRSDGWCARASIPEGPAAGR